MTPLWQRSAVELADGIAAKTFSSREVVESVLGRIAELNPHLNAITVEMPEEALAAADAADRATASGAALGPLHGVPATIKENVDVEGQPSPNGVAALADAVATEDAPVVRNLRRAGAIIIGRTNCPEFSMRGTTDNELRGRTYNPWDDDASPGGSSGGGGAAAAAGFGPIHHGNDIGGSLRFPAFANGLATVKPTTFRVPVYNSTAPAERGPLSQAMSCQGVMCRDVEDVRLATSVLVAPDVRDPNCPPVPFEGPPLDDPTTVAVTRQTFGYDMHPGIGALLDHAAEMLRDAGYRVVEADPPPVRAAADDWFKIGTTEMEATLLPLVQQYGSDAIKEVFSNFFDASDLQDRDGYIAVFGHRTRHMREWNLFLEQHPLVLTPFMMCPLYTWNYDLQGSEAFRTWLDATIYSFGVNYLGLPAGVLGTGFVEGLPAGIQVVGRRYREDVICDALQAIQMRAGRLTDQLWARTAGTTMSR